jgi:putative drug exporter of the RND superfamily
LGRDQADKSQTVFRRRTDRQAAAAARQDRPAVGWLWRGLAAIVVALRYPILLAWIAAAAAATIFLPGMATSGAIGDLVPKSSPGLQAEYDAARLFGVPLTSQVDIVQRDPRGLTSQAQIRAVRRAVAVNQGQVSGIDGLAGALPVANTGGLLPGSRERSTTIVTYLFFRPGTSAAVEAGGGRTFARRYVSAPQDHLAGVTGAAPARDAQGTMILGHMLWVELATLAAIGLIVGLHFRSVGAPLVTLACSGIAYLVAVRIVAWTGQRTGVTVPPDLEPVLVVLLLGVTTDYSVFFLAGMRSRLAGGLTRIQAARRVVAEYAPIILTAGLVVAAGTAALTAAKLDMLRAFGPGLALAVLTAMIVAVTLTPALIAIFGGLLFLPGPARLRRAALSRGGVAPGAATAASPGRERMRSLVQAWRETTARLATARPVALVIAAVCVAALLLAVTGLRQLRLGFPLIRALPATAEAARAETAAAKGFVPGILAPTEILVVGPGVTAQRPALARLQDEIARQPGVAGVVGPANLPDAQSLNAVLATSGHAARYALISRTDPLGATAIDQIRGLRRALPRLGAAAGLAGDRFEIGGETAVSVDAIDATVADMERVALVIALVIMVLLAVFLRALLAPLYLLAASMLALLSALGLTVWIFQGIFGYDSLVYYVPFAVAVLLVSLGSDYNVFVVGRIWEEARHRPLREAVATAAPRASRAITTAGLALAASFAALAIVPLDQFREIAVAMAIGIVIDTFVVRSLLVPALVVLFGRTGRWPGGRRTPRAPARRRLQPAPVAGQAEPATSSNRLAAGS